MSNKLVITDYNAKTLYAYIEDNLLTELSFEGSLGVLGNVYVGRVDNIVKNLNAAFVEIENKVLCYYSLDDKHIFLNKKNTDKLVIGDLILVQVNKDAIKTKNPMATANITLNGKYIVLDNSIGKIGVSNKITNPERKSELNNLAKEYIDNNYGAILRTDCKDANNEDIIMEINKLQAEMNAIFHKANHLKAHQLVYSKHPAIKFINEYSSNSIDEILTDDNDLYNSLIEYYSENNNDIYNKIKLYKDDLLGLKALYNINKQVDDALKKKVWLKSGGYLIIEQTEAMVVIDVNTGKSIDKKKKSENVFKVNVEAAIEIGKQLRLRNLSGIIIIDFINMDNNEYVDELIKTLKQVINRDKVKTTFVDITKLNLVEITRKKIKKSIAEQLLDI